MRAIFGVILALACAVPMALAWGSTGHRTVARIAQERLTASAERRVYQILKTNMSAVANWADDAVHEDEWKWSEPLHFINIIGDECHFDWNRDCKGRNGEPDFCVASAILNFTQQLAGERMLSPHNGLVSSDVPTDRALMFVIHFMGDISQPLHVGFDKDRGGHYDVTFLGNDTTLHKVWDFGMINAQVAKYDNQNELMFAAKIRAQIENEWSNDARQWLQCTSTDSRKCVTEWAEESINMACKWAYKDAPPGASLGTEYWDSRMPEVEYQLAKAGVRLAAVINALLK